MKFRITKKKMNRLNKEKCKKFELARKFKPKGRYKTLYRKHRWSNFRYFSIVHMGMSLQTIVSVDKSIIAPIIPPPTPINHNSTLY